MFLSYKNGGVFVEESAMSIPEVAKLYRTDNTKNKAFFEDCMTYLFFMYKRKGIYAGRLPRQAQDIIEKTHLKKTKAKEIEDDPNFKEVKKAYLDAQLTLTENFYEKVREDMQGLLNYISEIPYSKTAHIDTTVEVPGPDNIPTRFPVKAKVQIDNSKEKADAIALCERLINLEEKLSTRISKEEQDKKITDSKALFDIIN